MEKQPNYDDLDYQVKLSRLALALQKGHLLQYKNDEAVRNNTDFSTATINGDFALVIYETIWASGTFVDLIKEAIGTLKYWTKELKEFSVRTNFEDLLIEKKNDSEQRTLKIIVSRQTDKKAVGENFSEISKQIKELWGFCNVN